MNAQLLCIGNYCLDWLDGVYHIGGSVIFNAVTSNQLGVKPFILSRGQIDTIYRFGEFIDVDVRVIPDSKDTIFLYENSSFNKKQYLKSFSGIIKSKDVSKDLKNIQMVLLCPIAGELEPSIINNFSGLVVVALQGWLRGLKSDGRIFPYINDDLEELFRQADTIIVSEDDIKGLDVPVHWLDLCDIFIITRATKGATVFFQNEKYDIPALNVIEHDSIGAGDVFSTAYTIRFFETKDPVISAKFANIAAALSVRSSRFSSIPSRADVEKFIL